jgi:NAD(P)-dependent dehydrogenase (short-subunit alcohol dehydrogenase family)
MIDLSERVVIVTGASSGIGEAIAREFAGDGAITVLAARSADKLSALAAALREAGGTVLDCPTDVTSEAQILRLFATVMERFGRVDVLINNAGIADHTPTVDVSLAAWQRVIDTNLTSAFLCSREAMKIMKRQRRGRIINIGSVSAKVPRPDTIGYAATKFALDGLTRSLALDGREFGIAASILHPGVTTSLLSGKTRDVPATEIMPAMEVARIVVMMATLPDEMNLLEGLVLPIGMAFLGRG